MSMYRRITRVLLQCSVIGYAASAVAQDGLPEPANPASDAPIQLEGTTIRGDQELPLGLYITPWLDAEPEVGIDQPAQLLEEALLPIDPAAFRRQRLYWEALEQARPKPGETG